MTTNGKGIDRTGQGPADNDAPLHEISAFAYQSGFDPRIEAWRSNLDVSDADVRMHHCLAHIMASARANRSVCTLAEAWAHTLELEHVSQGGPSQAEWWRALQAAWAELKLAANREINMNITAGQLPAWRARERFDELVAQMHLPNRGRGDICEVQILEALMEGSSRTLEQIFQQVQRIGRHQAEYGEWYNSFVATVGMMYLVPTI